VIDANDPRTLVADVERRLEELEALPDAPARDAATEVVEALLDLYGAGLERIVEEIAARDDGELAEALVQDELVAHLLLLHGLHPTPLEERVRSALEQVRPYLESHGGNVELLEIDPPSVRLRLEGSCSGCPSSAMTLKLAIENAIHKEAPEIEDVLADGAVARQPESLLQLEIAPGLPSTTAGPASNPGPEWAMAGGLPELSSGGTVVKQVSGRPILFLRLQETLYGYRSLCPSCERSLADTLVNGTELTCPGCGNRYDALRAGRCLDAPQLHLEPVPLLVGDDGLVKVAVAAVA
jgi:Fe-S cluster biogenesis protein NfuA/nitrite reductase/ring-hydroxylating ferredoxin subunit